MAAAATRKQHRHGEDGVHPGAVDHPPRGQQHDDGHGSEQQRARGPVGPRKRAPRDLGEDPGDAGDPERGQRPGPAERRPRGLPQGGHQGGGDAGDGGGCDQGRREQVGHHTDGAHRPLEEDHDGGAHRLRRHRDRERRPPGPEASRQPCSDGLPPAAHEQQQAQGGEGGEREAVGAAQPRVEHQQDEDRGREHRDARRAPGLAEPQQADGSHRRGADDAGLGAGEDDEAGQHEQREEGPPPAAQAQHRCRPERDGQHDRDVRAADRGQVGHARREHRLGEVVGRPAGVADDERGQQAAGIGRQRCGGLTQAGPEVLGSPSRRRPRAPSRAGSTAAAGRRPPRRRAAPARVARAPRSARASAALPTPRRRGRGRGCAPSTRGPCPTPRSAPPAARRSGPSWPLRTTGSLATRPVATTTDLCSARPATGPACRMRAWEPDASSTRLVAAAARATHTGTRQRRRAPPRPVSAQPTASARDPPAAAIRHAGLQPRVLAEAVQPATAGMSSLRSAPGRSRQ